MAAPDVKKTATGDRSPSRISARRANRWDPCPAATRGSRGATAPGSRPESFFRLSAQGAMRALKCPRQGYNDRSERLFDLKGLSLFTLWKDNAEVLVEGWEKQAENTPKR